MKLLDKNSLRFRFLIGLLSIALLLIAIGISTLLLFNQIQWVEEVRNHSNKLEVLTLNLIKNDNDFFDFEATSENYFKDHNSSFLKRHDSLVLRITKGSNQLKKIVRFKNADLYNRLKFIDSLTSLYTVKFAALEEHFFKRGYKDFGIEGAMREHAHALEAMVQKDLSRSDLLMLRRVEKDFLLRHDTLYAQQFNMLIEKQILILRKDSTRYAENLYHFRMYQKEFNLRLRVEKEIGLSSHSGLRWDLNLLTDQLSNRFAGMSVQTDTVYRSILRSVIFIYTTAILIAIIIAIVSSFWISKKLAAPIVRLTEWVDDTTESFTSRDDEGISENDGEISSLTQSFVNLIKRTRKQMNEIGEKSELLDKQNQELVKLNHELDNFLYSTAHDLRSPLSSLSGLVRLMRMENRQPLLEEYLVMMDSNIRRQENFISQIVSYAKNGKLEITAEKIPLKMMILDIFKNHEFIEGANGIQKYISIEQNADFYSDKNRISIILNNLISNAVRYSDFEKGEDRFVEIKIEVLSKHAILIFTDNGVGIESEYLDKIFNMFFRANIHSKGSGLGLFILKEAVTKLNGEVSVESTLGAGTTFFIKIPNLVSQHATSAQVFAAEEIESIPTA